MAVVAIIGMAIIMIIGTGIGTGHGFPACRSGVVPEPLSLGTEGQKEKRTQGSGVSDGCVLDPQSECWP
jgi:hypothetical protein